MFVVAIVLAILAPIIGAFVQLAVSRQREYLADASSVELTRNPHGLEGALAKIAGDQEVLEVANRATQHMYFTNPIKKFEARSSGLFVDAPTDPRPDQPAARADRRAATRRDRATPLQGLDGSSLIEPGPGVSPRDLARNLLGPSRRRHLRGILRSPTGGRAWLAIGPR